MGVKSDMGSIDLEKRREYMVKLWLLGTGKESIEHAREYRGICCESYR